jgi:hypothetical protein
MNIMLGTILLIILIFMLLGALLYVATQQELELLPERAEWDGFCRAEFEWGSETNIRLDWHEADNRARFSRKSG